MGVQEADFRAPWWLRGAHLQTMWSTVSRRRPPLTTRRERFELEDGDFVDLDWTGEGHGPIVLLLHGLQGSINSPYARGLLGEVEARGWRGVLMHFRGCSGEPNRLPRAYHAGETGDVAEVVAELKRREPETTLAAVGYSLGGNVLLKWLGETGSDSPLGAAVAVSVPFDMTVCSERLDQGFSRLYQSRFLKELKASFALKNELGALAAVASIREWDDKVTAPLHGFDSAEDYYTRCSSDQFLKHIEIPTLVLHASDDPFMTPAVIPQAEALSASVSLEISQGGGHVGFIEGHPLRPRYWLESRIPRFLEAHIVRGG